MVVIPMHSERLLCEREMDSCIREFQLIKSISVQLILNDLFEV